jgi:hypothetical protein
MKKRLFILLVFLPFLGLSAQQVFHSFLFDTFLDGKVIYVNGGERTAKLNYDKVSERALFMLSDADSTILELANTSEIVKLNIANRTFEHIKNGLFYEKTEAGQGSLYVRWKSTVVSKGKAGGYGTSSATGAIDNVNQTMSRGGLYNLKPSEEFALNSHNAYYLKINGKFRRFGSFKSLSKLFKNREKEIEAYVKMEKPDFDNPEDIKKIVEYCYKINL